MVSWKRTLTILAFVQFVSAIGFSSIVPFLPLYIEDLDSTSGLSIEFLAGLIFSAQAFTMMIASPFWGALADRHGRKLMVVRASMGGGLTILLMAFVQTAEQLVLLRALQGALTGVMGATTALVAANVPRERAGYALGVLQVGLWGGVSVGPLVGGILADTWGFDVAIWATAVLLIGGGVLVWFGVDEHFEPLPRRAGRAGGVFAAWRHVMAAEGVRITYLARFLERLGRTMIFPFTPLLIKELTGSDDHVATLTGIVIALSAATGTLTAVYAGRLGDRIGHRRVLIAAALIAALFYIPMSAVVSVWQFGALLALAGALAGGIMPTLSALLAGYTERGEEGAAYGLETSIMAAARTIAPLLGAALAAWLGLRSIYVATGLVFIALGLIAVRWLPDVKRDADAGTHNTSGVAAPTAAK